MKRPLAGVGGWFGGVAGKDEDGGGGGGDAMSPDGGDR